MRRLPILLFTLAIFLTQADLLADAIVRFGIPFKPDPPPAVDGRLEDWQNVPNAWLVNTKEHAIWGGGKWASPDDLSAKVWLAWRQDTLYLAAEVSDDRHSQKGRGVAMWRGDHIELYLDITPDAEPERKAWGQGQIQFGFSPGNLDKTGDPLVDIAPEAVVFTPEGVPPEGVIVAAQKTEKGYALEAAIPWPLILSSAKLPSQLPTAGMPLSIEVGISDTDGPEAAQEKMMTLLTATWAARNRGRLMPAVLAPPDGVPPPVAQSVEIFGAFELQPKEKKELQFKSAAPPKDKDVVLSLKARLNTPRVAGYTHALHVTLNGVVLDGKRLLNRQPLETRVDGNAMSAAVGETFNTPYAPDFDSPDKSSSYGLRSGPGLCRFDLRITDVVHEGDNTLLIQNRVRDGINRTLVVGEGRLGGRTPVRPKVRRPAPTGPLPTVQPAASHKVDYSLLQNDDGSMALTVGGETFRIESEFSTPEPAWVKGSNRHFQFKRDVEQRDEAILVRDTFTNLTNENLPLMQRHRVFTQGKLKKVWLAGLSPSTLVNTSSSPGNPTTYGATERTGVGVMPLDDVSQVHVLNFTGEDHVGLADNQLVIRPGVGHVSEWAILPTTTPDYYAFLNAMRRLRDVNFRLDGSFAFLSIGPNRITDKWTDQQFTDFIRFKNAYFVCDGYLWPSYKGRFPHGTAFQVVDWSYFRKQQERVKKLAPAAKHLMYFHCFLDVLDEADQKYRDARLLLIDGRQADYGKPFDKIFVPTETNAFGRDMAKNVDMILGPPPEGFGCNGVYWDEFEYSRYQYHYQDFSTPGKGLPWDGVSADIDPKTMKIARLKSCVTLISQSYRLALAKRILEKHLLVGNGQPQTRTMVQVHFPRFVETGSITRCALAQAFSPIALGDHLTERSELDAYRVMLRALDYGCVYYWYSCDHVVPTHPHLTQYMFPLTPIQLGEGFIIAKERILTNRSGLFGWGDTSTHEVHVFNDEGRENADFKAPTVTQDGRTFTELRMAEDWSAAIVRK